MTVTANPATSASVVPQELAAILATARRERRAIPQLSDAHPGFDQAAGYAVQRVAREAAGPLVGWKLGVTSRAKQVQVNVDSPIYGFLAAEHPIDLGEPLHVDQHIQPRGEPEIVLFLGRDLAGPNVTAADVLNATSVVAVGSRCSTAATRTTGSRSRTSWPTTPRPAGTSSARPCRSPGSTCAWWVSSSSTTARSWRRRPGRPPSGTRRPRRHGSCARSRPSGEGLKAGELILTGGLTAAVPLKPGDTLVATVDRVGSVELACV